MESKPLIPRIALNSRVLAELVDLSGEAEQREFTLVTGKQADFKSGLCWTKIHPWGRALLGHSAGEVIPYAVGDLREVRILSVAERGRVDPARCCQETPGGCPEGGRTIRDHQPDDLFHCQRQ